MAAAQADRIDELGIYLRDAFVRLRHRTGRYLRSRYVREPIIWTDVLDPPDYWKSTDGPTGLNIQLQPDSEFTASQRRQRDREISLGTRPISIPPTSVLTAMFDLPGELQLEILDYLDFKHIERLRRTCRFVRQSLPPHAIKRLFKGLETSTRWTCRTCLEHFPTGSTLILQPSASVMLQDDGGPFYPLSAKCVDCTARKKQIRLSSVYQLGDKTEGYACRWCGRLTLEDGERSGDFQFHRECWYSYNWAVLRYAMFRWALWHTMFAADVACWVWHHQHGVVLASTVAGLIVAIWAALLSLLRGHRLRTYHWSLICELAITGLWIPPLYTLVGYYPGQSYDVRCQVFLTLLFVSTNIVLRFVNVLGTTLLSFEYKLYQQKRPGVHPLKRKFLNEIIKFIILLTYPQCVEHKYPGEYWFKGRRSRCGILGP